MSRNAKNVVIVMYKFSVVVKGIEKMLMDLGYTVDILSEDFSYLESIAETAGTFMVYLPSDIMDDPVRFKTLTKTSEIIISCGAHAVFVGEANYHYELVMALPKIKDFPWMDRPVEIEHLAKVMDKTGKEISDVNRKKRILIVDDDPSYAKMVREWIKDIYKVDIVTAGMQAITFLLKVPENDSIDLILLDYEMPVVDGPQVFQMLRQEPATEKIPVVFLTGLSTKEAVARVMALKPDGYVLKSTTKDALHEYLRGILAKQ